MAEDIVGAAAIDAGGYVYKLRFPNGKAYIGITSRSPADRFAEHVAYARSGRTPSALHLAIRKYGAENIRVESLSRADCWERLQEMEIAAIAEHRTRPPHGYNLTRGGDGVVGFDDVTRAKMGAKNKGRTHDAATREKIRIANIGRKHDEMARAKISMARKGIEFSAEHRANLRAALSAYQSEKRGGAPAPEKKKSTRTPEEIERMRRESLRLGSSPGARAKVAAALKGKPRPPEVMAKVAATRRANTLKRKEAGEKCAQSAWTGRKHTPEAIEKMSASQLARVRTDEEKAAQAAAMRRPEVRAKLAAAATGRKQSAETIAKRVAKTTGQKRSAETIERLRQTQLSHHRKRRAALTE